MRKARFKPWTERSRSSRSGQACRNVKPTTTSGTEPQRSSPPSTLPPARLLDNANPDTGTKNASVFLEKVDAATDSGLAVHLILDNYGTHKHPEVKEWFKAHDRYHVHFTPTSGSWLNQIERWFAEITRKRIRRGTFRSVRDLIKAIKDYVRQYNKHPQPFQWVASARKIIRKVNKYKETLETGD